MHADTYIHACIRAYIPIGRTDRQTDGRTDGKTHRPTDGRTDGHAYIHTYVYVHTYIQMCICTYHHQTSPISFQGLS